MFLTVSCCRTDTAVFSEKECKANHTITVTYQTTLEQDFTGKCVKKTGDLLMYFMFETAGGRSTGSAGCQNEGLPQENHAVLKAFISPCSMNEAAVKYIKFACHVLKKTIMIKVWRGSLGLDKILFFPPKGKSVGNVKCTFPEILPPLNLNYRKKENRTLLRSNKSMKHRIPEDCSSRVVLAMDNQSGKSHKIINAESPNLAQNNLDVTQVICI